MAASILISQRAIAVSVFAVRAFAKLRRALAENKELSGKVEQIERRIAKHDAQILALVQAIKNFISPNRHRKSGQLALEPRTDER
jgi:hypothetical protein